MTIPEALRAPVLWIAVERAGGGPARRDYRVLDAEGEPILETGARPWRREMILRTVAGEPALALVRRRSFPVSGKVDVLEVPAGGRLGIVTRGGRITASDGRLAGRLRDARALGARAREAAYMALFETLIGGEGSGTASGPDGFVYVVGDTPIGTLGRARPAFESAGDGASVSGSGWSRMLPAGVRERWRGGPGMWKLERREADPNDPLLVVGAALFAVELSHW